MNDDAELLRRYAEEGSQAAFAELVRRHVDLVYAAALRRTGGDGHRAADVAQQVFTALARHARKLARHAVLSAWLHTATRNAALNLMISEKRRQARESAALDLEPVSGGPDPDWDRLRPVLDAAIDELPETDRAAVVLRFLERRAFAEVGAALQVSEDAARMRTDRALDKLRALLARRGINSTAAALAAIVTSQPLISAPVGLAATLVSQSFAATAVVTSFMTTKIITTAALGAFLAFGLGAYVGHHLEPATAPAAARLETPREPPGQSQLIASLRQENQRLQAELDGRNTEVAQLNEANAKFKAELATPPPAAPTLGWMPRYERQRLVMNYLRQIGAARDQFVRDHGHAPSSVEELVGIDRYIKTVRPVSGEDYTHLAMEKDQPLSVTTADGMTVTYDPSGATTTPVEIPPEVARAEELSRKVSPAIQKAAEAYRRANPEAKSMPNPQSLIPYFATAQDGADFVEMLEAQKAAQAAQKAAPR